MSRTTLAAVLLPFLLLQARPAEAEANVMGQSGLIAMPDGRMERDGSLRLGYSRNPPYQTGWISFSFLPWLELSGGFTEIASLPVNKPGWTGYGNYKDKNVALKLRLTEELDRMPAIAVGVQDPQGTGLFRGAYVAASKRLGPADVTLGWGAGRFDGPFGGLRIATPIDHLSLIAEYDGNDYRKDWRSLESGVAGRKHAVSYGLEYRRDWWGAQVSRAYDEIGFNLYAQFDLNRKEFVPKVREPQPYLDIPPRPTRAMWQADVRHRQHLQRALYRQEFRDVRVRYVANRLEVELTHRRISSMSRALGRAARVALALAPLEAREIRLTYTEHDLPLATYTCTDLRALEDYFGGLITRRQLANTVLTEFAGKRSRPVEQEDREFLAGLNEELAITDLGYDEERGDWLAFKHEDIGRNAFGVRPWLQTYLNDPSGAFHYDLSALATVSRRLTPRTDLLGALKFTLVEDISEVTQGSNSLLPHVRTDVSEYKNATRVKVQNLLVNHYLHPAPRNYARLSAGIYEEMYGGVGGQWLYLPASGWWAADVATDWVKQRDFEGTGFRAYDTVTAIGSLHVKATNGFTATLRGGRFLARDNGLRVEVARRFKSGVEFGVWYSKTDGNDTTSPGSPSNPYNDKGVWLHIPFGPLSPKDSQAGGGISLAPWTRDVGQMVASPADLYALIEKPLLIDMQDGDGLSGFGDVDDDYPVRRRAASMFDRSFWSAAGEDAALFGRLATEPRFWGNVLIAGAATLASTALDKPADRWAKRHGKGSAMKGVETFGNALPLVVMGASGLAALGDRDPVLANAAYASLEAGTIGLVTALGAKYAIGRARPNLEKGAAEFNFFSSGNGDSAFPSVHSTVAWAALTPYAKAYDVVWPYALAAVTNLARIGERKHWLSDTVGGALLGYGLGSLMWENRRTSKSGPQIHVGPGEIAMEWKTP